MGNKVTEPATEINEPADMGTLPAPGHEQSTEIPYQALLTPPLGEAVIHVKVRHCMACKISSVPCTMYNS